MAQPWDQTFMDIARVMAGRSKDRSTQVGACLVSPDRRQLAVGYNGLPQAVPDDPGVLDKTHKFMDHLGTVAPVEAAGAGLVKHDLVVHAELNAILNCHVRPEGWTLYVTHIPCLTICVRHIIASGIKRVVACDELGETYMGYDRSELAFQLAGLDFELLT